MMGEKQNLLGRGERGGREIKRIQAAGKWQGLEMPPALTCSSRTGCGRCCRGAPPAAPRPPRRPPRCSPAPARPRPAASRPRRRSGRCARCSRPAGRAGPGRAAGGRARSGLRSPRPPPRGWDRGRCPRGTGRPAGCGCGVSVRGGFAGPDPLKGQRAGRELCRAAPPRLPAKALMLLTDSDTAVSAGSPPRAELTAGPAHI